MGAFAWVSFALVYLLTCPVFLIYSLISGSRDNVETNPIELLKGIAVWVVSLPFALVIFKIVDTLVSALNSSNILDAANQTVATQFSWILGLILIVGMTLLPFYFIMKGYGQFQDGIKIGDGGNNGK